MIPLIKVLQRSLPHFADYLLMSDKRSLTFSSNVVLFDNKGAKWCLLNIEKVVSLLTPLAKSRIASSLKYGQRRVDYFDGLFCHQVDFYLRLPSQTRRLKFAKVLPNTYLQLAPVNMFLEALFSDYAGCVIRAKVASSRTDLSLKFNSFLLFDLSGRDALRDLRLPYLPVSPRKLRVLQEVQILSSKFALHSPALFEAARQVQRVMNYVFSDSIFLLDATNMVENEHALVFDMPPTNSIIGVTLGRLPINDSLGKFSFVVHLSGESLGFVTQKQPPSLTFVGATDSPNIQFWVERCAAVTAGVSHSSGLYICNGYLASVDHGVDGHTKAKVSFLVDHALKAKLGLQTNLSFVVTYKANVVFRDSIFDFALLQLDSATLQVKCRKAAYQSYRTTSEAEHLLRLQGLLELLDTESRAQKKLFLDSCVENRVQLLGYPEFRVKAFANCCMSTGSVMKSVRLHGPRALNG